MKITDVDACTACSCSTHSPDMRAILHVSSMIYHLFSFSQADKIKTNGKNSTNLKKGIEKPEGL